MQRQAPRQTLSESFTKNKKRTSIKHLMKNNYLIAKPSGKNVKPFFSDKGVNSSKITLVEKNVIVVDEEKIANIMNNYFINITKNLNLKPSDKNKVENHIRVKKYMKPFRILFQRTFISKKYPKMM